MKTVIVFSVITTLIILNSGWNEGVKRKITSVEPEEPAGTCGNYSPETRGSAIFKAKCATCHSLDRDGTGPALKNVKNRLPRNSNYLELFVRNEDSLIKANDPYALKISKSRVPDYRHNYSKISKEDWEELENYLK